MLNTLTRLAPAGRRVVQQPKRFMSAAEPFTPATKAPARIDAAREVICAGGTWQGAGHPTWLKGKMDIPAAGLGFVLQGGILLGFVTGLYKMSLGVGKL